VSGKSRDSVKLFAPVEYGTQPCIFHEAPREMIDTLTGGCGPGGPGDFLVPDTMYLLTVRPACAIHDWMYYFGETHDDKEISDRVFLYNMLRIITAKTKWGWLKHLRNRRAYIYFTAVAKYGGPAFWKDKNYKDEMGEVVLW